MIKTKKNGLLKVAGLMMAVMMLTTCVISGTLAKYASSGSATVSAKVAKWDIQVDGEPITSSITLGDFTIYDTDGGTTNPDDQVEYGLIAPGTWGYTGVEITNASEVDANITAVFTKNATADALPNGMKFVVVTEEPTAMPSLSGADGALTASETIEFDAASKDVTFYIAFVWEFGSPTNDVNDTGFGTAAIDDADITLGNLTITADQVD